MGQPLKNIQQIKMRSSFGFNIKTNRALGLLFFKNRPFNALVNSPKSVFASFLLSFIFCHIISAQTTSLDRQTEKVPFEFLLVGDPDMEYTELLQTNPPFQPGKTLKFNNLKTTYWIRLDFKNNIDHLSKSETWRLRTNNFSKAFLYYCENDTIGRKPVGKFNKEEVKNSLIYTPGILFRKQNLIDQRYLYLKIQLTFPIPGPPEFAYLTNANNRFFTEYYTKQDLKTLFPDQIYLGVCGILFFTFLIIYLNIRRPEFLFYALYVLFSAFYLVQDNNLIPGYNTFYDTMLGYWSIVISQVLINLFYIRFAIHYLDTKNNYPALNLSMKAIIIFLIVLILVDFFVFSFGIYTIHIKLLNLQRLVMTLFGIFSMAYLLLVRKNKLAVFVVLGSFIYMVGALGYLFTFKKYYMVVGSTIEILIFSLGLAYKIKQEFEGKIVLQQELMSKEISALRAQMNPHFVFNALSSIQHLILTDDKSSALNYLSKFGKLARNVLESSQEATVTLTEEIELLRSYLELESLRFDHAFTYSINIDTFVDTDTVEVPLMLLQPFAENALIHGLVGKKKGDKYIHINVTKNGDHIVFEIDDNGIGRFSSKAKYPKRKRISRGMEITLKRIKMLCKSDEYNGSVEIVDKYDTNGKPSGTKVIIRICNP